MRASPASWGIVGNRILMIKLIFLFDGNIMGHGVCQWRSWFVKGRNTLLNHQQLGGWKLCVMAGWWFQTCFIFHNIWDVILPIDFHFSIIFTGCHPSHWRTHIFQDGWNMLKPPTRWYKGNNPVDKSIVSFPIGEGVFVTKMEEMRSGGYCDKMGTWWWGYHEI